MPKTIYRQVSQLFSMSRGFGQKKGQADPDVILGTKTYDEYKENCMRFAKDLAESRGTAKFQICSVSPDEVRNFLERLKLTRRPETVHQYASALSKLEKMCCKNFGKVSWEIDAFDRPRRGREDVTVQRGPAYTPEEADKLIREVRSIDPKAGDALEFIRATGCRAESVLGTLKTKGLQTYRDFGKAVTADRINLATRTVTLVEKGGKIRIVQYDAKYHSFIKRLVRENPKGNIFAGLRQSVVYSQIKMVSTQNGFAGRGLHGMRKSFAVERYVRYLDRVKELSRVKDWRTLAKEFPVSKYMAIQVCTNLRDKSADRLARLKLSRDLGHNRTEVTFRYVPKA